ncbi:MAG: glycosyl transferase family 1, partial [Flavobacterium psychrophilum]
IDHALYVGTNNKQYFLKHGLKESQLEFAPHAIDNERFSNGADVFEEEALKWRQELGLGTDEVVVLFAGKFEPKKNPFFIL